MPRLASLLRVIAVVAIVKISSTGAWGAESGVAPSFFNDVIPVLTRMGCNQGACHGKLAGQNGFRLSLRGYAPEWDYNWITREYDGRRINRGVPEASLLLCKPLGVMPHGGGKILLTSNQAYKVLHDWIAAGAPGPRNEARVRALAFVRGGQVLKVGETLQLAVRADFSDSTHRDVTWLAQFASNDSSVAEVDAEGLVRMLRPGETAVRATFMGLVATAIVTAPYDRSVPPELLSPRNNFVDAPVFEKLARLHIEPSGLCSDEAFLRRSTLDTIGCLPTPEEIRAFRADSRLDKRSRWIDALLNRPEYVDYWALQLGDLFQNRKESDHDVRGTKGVRSFHEWLRRQVTANRPWSELATEALTASGKATENPAVGYFIVTVGEQREPEKSEVASSVAQALLGTRIGCAKCHNHPLEKYTQSDFYHFAAFFSPIKLNRKDPQAGTTVLEIVARDGRQKDRAPGVVQPRTGQFLKPQPLDRTPMDFSPGEDPRVKLAAWITDPKNEYFAGAMVNRLWRHFLGVGLVEPVDDLRASNPPTNPELWQALIQEFVGHHFDMKHIMRCILNSRTYQLSSATTAANEKDNRFYSHYYVRRLPAEVMLDAIAQSTGVPETFAGYPQGLRAQQVPDPAVKSYFLSLFGRSNRITACACERTGDVTMPQLLHLAVGDTIVNKIRSPQGSLAELLRLHTSPDRIIEELYLATLSRPPSAAERQSVIKLLGNQPMQDAYSDLFWALLNSKDFAFNH